MSDPLRVYLSGPMTGLPAFNAAAVALRGAGYDVFNPAESFGGDTTRSRMEYMRLDIAELLCCGAVAVLDGWQQSRGAALEVAIAVELGLPIFGAWTLETVVGAGTPPAPTPGTPARSETVLQEAQRLVHGNRGADYGHPIDDFSRTAALWNAQFRDLLTAGAAFRPEDIWQAMVCVKLSRERHRPKRDNRTDIAGYAETGEMVADERARRTAA